ncbi:hypothetical protein ACFLYO_10115 [Chloroflexota bacterium]
MLKLLSKFLSPLTRLPLAALPAPEQSADEPAAPEQPNDGIVYFMVYQYPGPPKAALAEWFTAQGYPPNEPLTGGGGGGGYSSGRMVYEGHGHGISGKTADGIEVGSGSGGGSVGYTVFKNDLLRVSPLFGVGGGAISVGKPFANDDTPPPADTSEQDEPANITLNIVETGVGIDFTLPTPKVKLMIGLRLGYRYVIGHGPEPPNLNGPFLRVMAGMKF